MRHRTRRRRTDVRRPLCLEASSGAAHSAAVRSQARPRRRARHVPPPPPPPVRRPTRSARWLTARAARCRARLPAATRSSGRAAATRARAPRGATSAAAARCARASTSRRCVARSPRRRGSAATPPPSTPPAAAWRAGTRPRRPAPTRRSRRAWPSRSRGTGRARTPAGGCRRSWMGSAACGTAPVGCGRARGTRCTRPRRCSTRCRAARRSMASCGWGAAAFRN
mmetsp:Transcript_53740/g.159165  ORF Transcript_53740/g.159165 Transcript_53740/m.159165 type:complete len:225 (+) Transcript_53740:1201-1875(+)